MSQISYGTITITDITDIDTIKNWYLATSASSGVTKSTSGWTDTIQQMTSTKQYLWNYEQVLGANNIEISSTDPVIIGRYGQDGQSGADGNSIVSIDEYYQATNSTTNPGASGWQKNTIVVPTSTNKYLWNYQVINYSKTAAEGSYADARIIGVYGDTGPQGNPGTAGINTATVYLYQRATDAPSKPNGNLTYTFASASITSGSLGNWKQSIGELSGTDPIWVIAAVASSNGTTDVIASTEWSTQIKLAQNGTNGTNGTDGTDGINGTDGLNQATVYIYKRATSATAPSATTYTFSNGSFTVPSGWSKTIPASDGNPCYVSSAVAIGSGTTATLTWNTPSVLVEDGSDGISPTVTSTSTGVKIVDAAGNTTYINNGSNGQSYYTHIRYATDSSGSDMSSSPTGKTYIGVYSGTSSTAPSTASSYTWSKYVGDPGTPATQYYAFVKYATDANGTGMQDSPDSTHIYVGTYTGTNSSPAASAYKWSKYVGDDGQSATQYYAFVKYATDGNGTNMQDSPDSTHIYVGTYTGTNASPTASLYEWSKYVGDNGVSVTEVKEVYCLTNGTPPTLTPGTPITSVSTSTGVWTTVVPIYVTGYTYYTSIQTSLSSGTSPIFSTPIQNQGLTTANSNAATAKAATDLLGGYFIYKGSSSGQSTPSGAGIIQQIDDDPAEWGYNTWIGSNGINLRYGETVLSNWGTDSLTFYTPTTANGITTTAKTIELNSTNGLVLYKDGTNKGLQLSSTGLEIFGSSQSTADVTVTSNGINIGKGSIVGADNTVTNYVPDSGFLYLSTKNYNAYLNVAGSGNRTDWRLVVGNNFGITKDGNVYMSGATVSGKIVALTGQIGGTYVGDSWGWTLSTGQLYTGTIGTDNSLHMRSFNLSSNVSINGESRADWRFTIGSKFGVTSAGTLYASGAEISGKISATSGTIGAANATNKITIGENTTNASIYYGMSSLASTSNGFYIGTDGISIGGGKFKVTNTGAITATGLIITGYATTQDNEDAKKVATDFLEKSGSSITLKTGWNSDYMTMTSDGTRIYCNNKALASFTTSGATIQAQNENDKINLSSSGLKVYKGGSLVAEFGSTINLQSSYGDLLISSTGVNITTTGSAKGAYLFGGEPLLTVIPAIFVLGSDVASKGEWKIYQTFSTDITDYYTVLGIVGYNFDKYNSSSGGMSYFNVWECSLPLRDKGTSIQFQARNMWSNPIKKGIKLIVYLLAMPKNPEYNPSSPGDGGDETDTAA